MTLAEMLQLVDAGGAALLAVFVWWELRSSGRSLVEHTEGIAKHLADLKAGQAVLLDRVERAD